MNVLIMNQTIMKKKICVALQMIAFRSISLAPFFILIRLGMAEVKKARDFSVVFARMLASPDGDVRRKAVKRVSIFFQKPHEGFYHYMKKTK